MLLLICSLCPICIGSAIILITNKKNDEPFENKLRAIYCYLIIFVSLIGLIYGGIGTIISLGKVLVPNLDETTNIRNENIQSFIMAFSLFIVFTPLFISYKKVIEKEKKK